MQRLFITLSFALIVSGFAYAKEIRPNDNMQKGKFASEPGYYELAINFPKPIINPGDTTGINILITGYGTIKAWKLVFYPSPDIFDLDNCYASYLGQKKRKFGQQGRYGLTLTPKPDKSLKFFDIKSGNPPQIRTETFYKERADQDEKLASAPVQLSLKTLPDVRPGRYEISFYLTYYNGVEWRVSKERAQFTIRNILQRYEKEAWYLAIVAAICAIAGPVRRIIKWLFNLVLNKYFPTTE